MRFARVFVMRIYYVMQKEGDAMRITINVPDNLKENLKREAGNRNISVSRLVSEALDLYLLDSRRRALGKKVLDLAGKAKVSASADLILEKGRRDDRP
ncbi:conserved hypothetical protein [Syntrophobacter sp. SbD1]|nr:conserved hypothetical protein [Syntrophobacter sp. SbD1]